MTILRVPLDACEVQSGRTDFEGAPLTGVAAEVVGPATGYNLQVYLWEYRDGQRVGVWHEASFLGDQSLLLADDSLLSEDEAETWLVGRPAIGAVVVMSNSRVRAMFGIRDGVVVASPYTRWHGDDGSLATICESAVFEQEDGSAIRVSEIYEWEPGVAFRFGERGAMLVRLGFHTGVGWVNPGVPAIHGAPFTFHGPNDSGFVWVKAAAGRDQSGRVDRFGIRGHGYEWVLKHTPGFSPLVWFPDAAYIGEQGFAPSLDWDCDSEGHNSALVAIGGIEAMGGIEVLGLSTSELSVDQLVALLGLPSLLSIDLSTARNPEWVALVRREAKAHRPDLYVTQPENA